MRLDLASIDSSFAETPDAAAKPVAVEPSPETPRPPLPATKNGPPPPSVPSGLARPHPSTPDTSALPAPPSPATSFAAQPAPRHARVIAPARPRRDIAPEYPRESRLRGEQGNVTLEIDVSTNGGVVDVRVRKSSEHPLLDDAAVKAVRVARFAPAMSNGVPVASTIRLTLNFKLK